VSGMWNRTLVYLGLKEEPEEGYDPPDAERFDADDDPHAEHAPPRGGEREPTREVDLREEPSDVEVVPAERGGSRPRPVPVTAGAAPDETNVRPLRTGDVHVRAVGASGGSRVAVVQVDVFEDVESIGSRYRTGQAVLFDVGGADASTGRRVVDFVAGLTFALRGKLSKVGAKAFLLVPDGIELSSDERRRLGELGYRMPTGSDA
jgi:cell division inhibitor SepF